MKETTRARRGLKLAAAAGDTKAPDPRHPFAPTREQLQGVRDGYRRSRLVSAKTLVEAAAAEISPRGRENERIQQHLTGAVALLNSALYDSDGKL